jgi:hypothetical protein
VRVKKKFLQLAVLIIFKTPGKGKAGKWEVEISKNVERAKEGRE